MALGLIVLPFSVDEDNGVVPHGTKVKLSKTGYNGLVARHPIAGALVEQGGKGLVTGEHVRKFQETMIGKEPGVLPADKRGIQVIWMVC